MDESGNSEALIPSSAEVELICVQPNAGTIQGEAQEYVTRHMLAVRKKLLKKDQKPLLRFPGNGLWATDVLAVIS